MMLWSTVIHNHQKEKMTEIQEGKEYHNHLHQARHHH